MMENILPASVWSIALEGWPQVMAGAGRKASGVTWEGVGGVILFGHNVESLAQVRRLNQELQQLAADNGLPPLIISLDEEGGRVSRMPPDSLELTAPSQMAQGAAGGDAARLCAIATARN